MSQATQPIAADGVEVYDPQAAGEGALDSDVQSQLSWDQVPAGGTHDLGEMKVETPKGHSSDWQSGSQASEVMYEEEDSTEAPLSLQEFVDLLEAKHLLPEILSRQEAEVLFQQHRDEQNGLDVESFKMVVQHILSQDREKTSNVSAKQQHVQRSSVEEEARRFRMRDAFVSDAFDSQITSVDSIDREVDQQRQSLNEKTAGLSLTEKESLNRRAALALHRNDPWPSVSTSEATGSPLSSSVAAEALGVGERLPHGNFLRTEMHVEEQPSTPDDEGGVHSAQALPDGSTRGSGTGGSHHGTGLVGRVGEATVGWGPVVGGARVAVARTAIEGLQDARCSAFAPHRAGKVVAASSKESVPTKETATTQKGGVARAEAPLLPPPHEPLSRALSAARSFFASTDTNGKTGEGDAAEAETAVTPAPGAASASGAGRPKPKPSEAQKTATETVHESLAPMLESAARENDALRRQCDDLRLDRARLADQLVDSKKQVRQLELLAQRGNLGLGGATAEARTAEIEAALHAATVMQGTLLADNQSMSDKYLEMQSKLEAAEARAAAAESSKLRLAGDHASIAQVCLRQSSVSCCAPAAPSSSTCPSSSTSLPPSLLHQSCSTADCVGQRHGDKFEQAHEYILNENSALKTRVEALNWLAQQVFGLALIAIRLAC